MNVTYYMLFAVLVKVLPQDIKLPNENMYEYLNDHRKEVSLMLILSLVTLLIIVAIS